MPMKMLNSIKNKQTKKPSMSEMHKFCKTCRIIRIGLFHVVCSQGWAYLVWCHLWLTHVFCNQQHSGHAAQLVYMLCYSTIK